MRRHCLSIAFLTKLAKHLVILACLAIVGETSGRLVIGQRSIFLLIVLAALIDSAGRTFQRRLHFQILRREVRHDRRAASTYQDRFRP